MGGSTTINISVYVQFGGSPRIKAQPLKLVVSWIVKNTAKKSKR